MSEFVRFGIDSSARFDALQQVFEQIKVIKNLDYAEETLDDDVIADYDIELMRGLMPPDVQANFIWPADDEVEDHHVDQTKPIAISPPGAFLGERWSLIRILDLIDEGDYMLDRCERAGEIGELRVQSGGYPYGGLNALIALIEGFGFRAVGVNEYGKYKPFAEVD